MWTKADTIALYNEGFRRGGVINLTTSPATGAIYQYTAEKAEEFCRAACDLEIYFEELT